MDAVLIEARCSGCKKAKPVAEFGKNSRTKTGLSYYCRDCARDRERNRSRAKGVTPRSYSKIDHNATEKACTRCRKTKPLAEFSKSAATTDGHCIYCFECTRESSSAYKQANGDSIRRKAMQAAKASPRRNWARMCLASHKSNGYDVQIELTQLVEVATKATECPLCGCTLNWEYGVGSKWDGPSLDRINNESHMTMDNTAIICRSCNVTKRDRTMQEFLAYCMKVIQRASPSTEGMEKPSVPVTPVGCGEIEGVSIGEAEVITRSTY